MGLPLELTDINGSVV
ncbi:hypothetical protein [Pseudomonas sp.]